MAVLLKDAEPAVKVSVVDALARLGSRNAVEPLVAAANDPDLYSAPAKALGTLGDRRGTMAVVHVLVDARNATTRSRQVLGKLQDVRGRPIDVGGCRGGPGQPRGHHVRDERRHGPGGDRRSPGDVPAGRVAALPGRADPDERGRVAVCIRDPAAVAPLIAAPNADDSTAGAAALALGEIGDPAAIEPLAALLFGRGEHGGLAFFGADALAKIRSPRAIRVLVEGTIAVKKYGQHTFRAGQMIEKLLDVHFFNPDELVRWWAEHRHEFDGE